MGYSLSRSKGSRGESEILMILHNAMIEVYRERGKEPLAPVLTTSSIGFDIKGLTWLAPEVKRVENDLPGMIDHWWGQCKRQAKEGQIPVLFYRKNNRPWNVRMYGHLLIDGEMGPRVRMPVDIGLAAFTTWFKLKIAALLD